MVLVAVRYSFSQRFSVPVQQAFEWSIDYDPDDFALMGEEGKRKITRLTEDTFILEDAKRTAEGIIEKTRLVRINPEKRSFSNTHITGPTLHSQYWYEFFPDGKGRSRLEFTGLMLHPSEQALSRAEVSKIAAKEKKADSLAWKNLAKAMEADLRKKKTKR